MSEWISVKERLPKYEGEVRIKLRDSSELEGAIWQSDGDWWWDNKFFVEECVTHWMHTDPPKEQP